MSQLSISIVGVVSISAQLRLTLRVERFDNKTIGSRLRRLWVTLVEVSFCIECVIIYANLCGVMRRIQIEGESSSKIHLHFER